VKMKDLEDKYAHILSRIDKTDPKTTTWDMLDDENLPFSERVRAYTMSTSSRCRVSRSMMEVEV
jgi:hypothetical protein